MKMVHDRTMYRRLIKNYLRAEYRVHCRRFSEPNYAVGPIMPYNGPIKACSARAGLARAGPARARDNYAMVTATIRASSLPQICQTMETRVTVTALIRWLRIDLYKDPDSAESGFRNPIYAKCLQKRVRTPYQLSLLQTYGLTSPEIERINPLLNQRGIIVRNDIPFIEQHYKQV